MGSVTLFEPGDVLAKRFRILEYRARGVAGETYRCIDEETKDTVAVKVALSDGDMGWSDFTAQYRKLLRIYSPGVARVLGLFRHGTRACLVLEWIEGKDLAAWAAEHGLKERLQALVEIARAVRDLHREGITHGDLRDGVNVMAAEDRGCVLIDPEPEMWGKTSGNRERQGDHEALASVIELLAPELSSILAGLVTNLRTRPAETSIDAVVGELTAIANRPPMIFADSATVRAAAASVRQSIEAVSAAYVRYRQQRQAAIDRLAAECGELAEMFGLTLDESTLDHAHEEVYERLDRGMFLARSLEFTGPHGSCKLWFEGTGEFKKPMPYPPKTIAIGGWQVDGVEATRGYIRLDIGDAGESALLVTPPVELDMLYEEPRPPEPEDYQPYESQWLLRRISDLTGQPIAEP